MLLCPGLLLAFQNAAHADTPAGWISSGNRSAYTTNKGALELSAGVLAVNDEIDFLNVRDDILAETNRLAGNSGDLAGRRFELHYGISTELEIHGRYQSHALTVDLDDINSINLVDIDNSLDTEQYAAGLKWTIYRGFLTNPDNRHSALSIEAEAYRNESDDFDVVLDELSFGGIDIFFRDPQTFSVTDLEDEGWRTRLYYSRPWSGSATLTAWLGYGRGEATSGTGSDLTSVTIARFFEQAFEREESYFFAGLSLNWYLLPRLPFTLSYETIRLGSEEFRREPLIPPSQLPGFLAASGGAGVDENHTLSGTLSWWLTPKMSVGGFANVYTRQFTGLVPHYNNPLSESFTSLLYGFAGLQLTYRL